MKSVTYSCDVCHKPKGATNHWWLVRRRKLDQTQPSLILEPWDEEAAQSADLHICGEACVITVVSEFMSSKQ